MRWGSVLLRSCPNSQTVTPHKSPGEACKGSVWAETQIALFKEEPQLPYCLGDSLVSCLSQSKSGFCTSCFLTPLCLPVRHQLGRCDAHNVRAPEVTPFIAFVPLILHIMSGQKWLSQAQKSSHIWCGVSEMSLFSHSLKNKTLKHLHSSCRRDRFLPKHFPCSLENTCVKDFCSVCLFYFSGSHGFCSASEWWAWVRGRSE